MSETTTPVVVPVVKVPPAKVPDGWPPSRADRYLRAAEIMAEKGLCKIDATYDDAGHVCLIKAISLAGLSVFGDDCEPLLMATLNAPTPDSNPAVWSMRPDTTTEDAVALLKQASSLASAAQRGA